MFFNGSLGPQYIGRCCPLSRGSLFSAYDTRENISRLSANKLSTKNIMSRCLSILQRKKMFFYCKVASVNFLPFKCIFFIMPSFICVCEQCGNGKQFNL